MDTFKIRISRVITSLAERLKTCLHQCADAAAQNSLLTEQVRLRLRTERRFENASSRPADRKRIRKRHVKRLSRRILLHCHKTRNALSCLILAANRMSRPFWSDHRHIDIFWRHDLSEMNVKAVRKHQHIASFQIWLDGLFVHFCLKLIIDQDHNNICFFRCLCCRIYFKTLRLCLCP